MNAISISFGKEHLVTLLVHEIEFLSLSQILDKYAEWSGIERSKLTGDWTNVIDITSASNGVALRTGYAKNDWN